LSYVNEARMAALTQGAASPAAPPADSVRNRF
jgi:hypothetical protein